MMDTSRIGNWILKLTAILATSLSPLCAQEGWQTSDTAGLLNSWSGVAYGGGVFIAVNGWGKIARSTDGGQTFTEVLDAGWAIEDVEYGSNGSTMAFWATGRSGSGDFLYESTDGGQTWNDRAGEFPFPFSDGGADISLDVDGNLIYTKLRGNNNIGDAFLYQGTYYAYGSGPESSVLTSTNGTDFTTAVADSGLWLLGGIELDGNALVYGVTFETPGDFSTRRGVVFEPTTNPSAPGNPTIIETSNNTYISDIDQDPATPTTLYATGGYALLTSFDSGASWTADAVADGTVLFDMSEMAIGDSGRVAVGAQGIYYLGGGNDSPTEWGGYPIVDGYVDTIGWTGLLYAEFAPWIYFVSLDNWAFIPEPGTEDAGGWVFIPSP
ncbi:hypothetical protein G0Q06_10660 [Puniceicoccales bacterium CK1056]|uniref:Photosynthesis system II assembly factor Ycf48/Hcf136-like domain-containing protein n=1 Tax=Oceanipulchritudo coccoides TaxID=2706888 RepID=A0A6B2M2E5_9BACT|nr:hypothetical protein [Oceanipulchritudo coccoides]NDV62913.1 hypothetical protein [Oceanipulchritudo coccoides]